MAKMRGAAAVAMQVTTSMSVAAAVRSRLTTSSPLRRRSAWTICGTRMALRMPPIIMLYRYVGRLLAVLKASAAPDPVAPSAMTMRALRTMPRTRETRVPEAMMAEDRARDA